MSINMLLSHENSKHLANYLAKHVDHYSATRSEFLKQTHEGIDKWITDSEFPEMENIHNLDEYFRQEENLEED